MHQNVLHARLAHALELLRIVLDSDKPADYLIAGYIRDHRALERESRGVVVELVYATLRRKIYYDVLAGAGASVESALVLAACDTGLGAPMAVADAVAQSGSADRATLASLVRSRGQKSSLEFVEDELDRFAALHSTPRWIVDELGGTMIPVDIATLLDGLNERPPLALRVNTYKASAVEVRDRLAAEGVRARPGRVAANALIADRERDLFGTHAFRDGLFELQDEGSQLVSELVAPRPGSRVLDVCAGAGGKTLHLGALMKGRGEVFAWDTDARRLSRIDRRIRRSGLQNVRVLRNREAWDAFRERSSGALDRVLVDAPCSGLGTLRRSPDIKLRATPELVELMTAKQRAILVEVAGLVKPGGRMVYATCSILPRENGEIVDEFLASHGEFGQLERRVLTPHEHGTDGFFVAVLERMGGR